MSYESTGAAFKDDVSAVIRKADLAGADAATPVRTFGDITPALVHDLKGPLSAITMNVDFALDQLPNETSIEHVKCALEDCRAAAARLFRMIANLLDVARCEEGRMRPSRAPVTIETLLAQMIDGYAVDAGMRRVDLALDVDPSVGVIESDGDLLTRVLQSIVDNALRHTRPRGHVLVTARRGMGAHGEETVKIRIANDGAPLAPEVRGRLFQRMLGSESNGAGANRGLGLYFCRLAIEAMGGTIRVAEEPGYAVCFEIELG